MNVIFLDIDGVLNSENLANKRIAEGVKDFDNDEYTFIDEHAVNMLVKFCESNGVKLVISSSWRSQTLEDTIRDFLRDRYKRLHPIIPYIVGITSRIFYHIISTDSHEPACRGDEIKKYLDDHPEIENYVILDDDSDMLEEQMDHFVQTSWTYGLQKMHLSKIYNILKNG